MSYDLNIQDEGDKRHIWIRGEIDEDFDASQLRKIFTNNVILHLEDVKSISSCGIREWISFISELPETTSLEFEKCSIPITRQFGMLSNFRGHGLVKSFFAPYYCDECDEETERCSMSPTTSSPRIIRRVRIESATHAAINWNLMG